MYAFFFIYITHAIHPTRPTQHTHTYTHTHSILHHPPRHRRGGAAGGRSAALRRSTGARRGGGRWGGFGYGFAAVDGPVPNAVAGGCGWVYRCLHINIYIYMCMCTYVYTCIHSFNNVLPPLFPPINRPWPPPRSGSTFRSPAPHHNHNRTPPTTHHHHHDRC